MIEVKICGVTDPASLEAAVEAGARLIGFVFYPRSPRHLSPETAWELARRVPTGVRAVGLFVDPDDATLARTLERVPLDLLQLHGRESPFRVADIRAATGLEVMKALPIGGAEDFGAVAAYAPVADRLLFDAKPPVGLAALPGGNGLAFDWALLAGRPVGVPWMLAGGLTPETVGAAVRVSGARAVDVSSGVETRPGVKDPALIRRFVAAARAADPSRAPTSAGTAAGGEPLAGPPRGE